MGILMGNKNDILFNDENVDLNTTTPDEIEELDFIIDKLCSKLNGRSEYFDKENVYKFLNSSLPKEKKWHLPYSRITNFFMFQLGNDLKISTFMMNLNNLYNYAIKLENLNQDTVNFIKKVSDHCDLVTYQMQHIKTKIDYSLLETKRDINQTINEKSMNLQKDSITILGIFSAIVIAFSGSISILGNAFANITSSNLRSVLLVLFVAGLIFGDCLYILLSLICKLTDKDLFSKPIKNKPNDYLGKIKYYCLRIPFIFYYNVMLILIAGFVYWRM